MLDRLIPGHCLPLCASCAHRGPDLSHPMPCHRVRWEGHKHVVPTIVADADGVVGCSDYTPTTDEHPGEGGAKKPQGTSPVTAPQPCVFGRVILL
jgi:hypothetical protein